MIEPSAAPSAARAQAESSKKRNATAKPASKSHAKVVAPADSNWVTKQFVDYVIVETQDDDSAMIRGEKKRWEFSSAMPPLQQIAILEPINERPNVFFWDYSDPNLN